MPEKLKAGDLVAADGWNIVDTNFSNPVLLDRVALEDLLKDPDRYRAVDYEIWREYEAALDRFSKAVRAVKECPRIGLAPTPEKKR